MNAIFHKTSRDVPIRQRPELVLLGFVLLLTACSSRYGSTSEIFGQVESSLQVVLAIIGGLLLVAGFAIHEFIVQVLGFIAGGLLGAFVGGLMGNGDGGSIFLGFIVGGVVGAALALALTCLTVFLGGFFAGVIFLGAISYGISHEEPNAAVLVVGGVIGGFILLALYRFWITALTAGIGSILFGLGVSAPIGLWLVFFIVGIAIQYGAAKAAGKEEEVKPGYSKPEAVKPAAYSAQLTSGPGAVRSPNPAPPAAYPIVGQPYPQQWSADLPQASSPMQSQSSLPPLPPASEKFCIACGKRIPAQAAACPYCSKSQ